MCQIDAIAHLKGQPYHMDGFPLKTFNSISVWSFPWWLPLLNSFRNYYTLHHPNRFFYRCTMDLSGMVSMHNFLNEIVSRLSLGSKASLALLSCCDGSKPFWQSELMSLPLLIAQPYITPSVRLLFSLSCRAYMNHDNAFVLCLQLYSYRWQVWPLTLMYLLPQLTQNEHVLGNSSWWRCRSTEFFLNFFLSLQSFLPKFSSLPHTFHIFTRGHGKLSFSQ